MSKDPRPNIIFYFSDQQRADTCGCYGQPLNVTPNLDLLAADGTLFLNAYTCQPVCGPARACLQSGQYATAINCYRNAQALPTDIPTLAQAFNDAGYDTAYIGKWHLATTKESYDAPIRPDNYETSAIPPERMGGYRHYFAADVLEFTSHGYDGYVFDETGARHDFIGYRADAINNYAIHYLHERADKDKPLFMFISQIEPHHQNDHGTFEGPDGSREKFGDFVPPIDLKKGEGDWEKNYPDYLGQCHSLDENVGRLMDTLKTMGMADNTILIYASDHGSHFCTRNGEYKRSCHDASIHVPMIACGGPFSGKGPNDHVVSLMDIPATLLSCAGITPPETFSGRSLKELVEGRLPDWDDCAFLQISESQVGRCIRTPRWTYSVRADADGWLDSAADAYYEEFLYDNETDPAQFDNRVTDPALSDVRSALREKLLACMKEAGEAVPEILPCRK